MFLIFFQRATFNTPFMKIGQSPEGCSSYLFPKIMGQSRANEMLMFDQKITASEAKEAGLITKVVPHVALMDEVGNLLGPKKNANEYHQQS